MSETVLRIRPRSRRYLRLHYRLLREYGNGRLRALLKALQLEAGQPVRTSPRYWT